MAQDKRLNTSADENTDLRRPQRQNGVAYMPDFFARLRNFAGELAQGNPTLNLEADLFFGNNQNPVLALNVARPNPFEDDETIEETVELYP